MSLPETQTYPSMLIERLDQLTVRRPRFDRQPIYYPTQIEQTLASSFFPSGAFAGSLALTLDQNRNLPTDIFEALIP